jgi:hypothetical protein
MNPYLQIPNLPPGKFRVGQAVRVKTGFRTATGVPAVGEVVEDRGPIGVGGRRLYHVRLRPDPWNELIVVREEESLEAVGDGPDAVAPADGKGA